ncbi:MAG: efflux RND transporter permease subunit, partial [Acidobacteria bacterium]
LVVPVAFRGGIVVRFFDQFGMTVGVAVLVSLFVSFTLDPMLSSRWYDPAVETHTRRRWFARQLQKMNDSLNLLQGVLGRTLGWSLRHRLIVLGIGVACIVFSFNLLGKLGSDFMPDFDREEFQVSFKAPSGMTLAETSVIAQRVHETLKRYPEVAYTVVTIGTGTSSVNQGSIYVKLTAKDARQRTDMELRRLMREDFDRWASLETSVEEAEQLGDARPIQISVRGTDLDEIDRVSKLVVKNVAQVKGATDVDTSQDEPRPEVRVQLDRKAASDLGLNLGTVAMTVRGLIAGEVVSQYEDRDGDAFDVRLRVDQEQRRLKDDLAEIYVPVMDFAGATPAMLTNPSSMATSVPLSQVASLEDSQAPSLIRRRDLMREVRVRASNQDRDIGSIIADVKTLNDKLQLPPGVTIGYTGQAEDLREMQYHMGRALFLAIVFIYAILASQFRSFFHPLAIMLSLPLSLLGVALALYVTNGTLNIMSQIGLIMLMGLVTKNAILLIDYANRQQREGQTRTNALITAARVRLRPIVMTTTAMIFGMLPLAFEIGAGSEMRAPMARAVIGGLITSTLLTLIMVPVVYTFFDDWAARMRHWWHRNVPQDMQEEEPAPEPEMVGR